MGIFIFFKQSGNSSLYKKLKATQKDDIIAEMKEDANLSGLADAFKMGLYSCANDTRDVVGGVYYMIDNEPVALKHMRDIAWIKRVKEEAAKYPKSRMHVVEYYRSVRKGNFKAADKCKLRISKNYNFEPIYWSIDSVYWNEDGTASRLELDC